ncbi:MAG: glycosyltransferase, partial [Verrucomicrobiae bacterium]|nr:glycosyltransferase [Verrucomicrobiae bacterium]
FDVDCLIVGNHDQSLSKTISSDAKITVKNIPRTNILSYRFTGLKEAYRWIGKDIPQYLYLRYPLGCPLSAIFTHKVSALGVKIITEHQSKEPKELFLLKKRLFMISDWLFGRSLLSSVSLVIGVTPEIRDFEKKRAPKAQTVSISNGVDLQEYPLRNYHIQKDKVGIDMLFTGALAPWHGLDRLIRAMRPYSGCQIRLHIAGDGEEMDKLKSMAKKLPKRHSVIFHGYLDKEGISSLFDVCDVAIGSLALDRNGLRQACTLKTREYAARGIPFVINYGDPDFQGVPWVLRLPSKSQIDIHRICSWSSDNSQKPEEIRAKSSSIISYEEKARQLKQAIREKLFT